MSDKNAMAAIKAKFDALLKEVEALFASHTGNAPDCNNANVASPQDSGGNGPGPKKPA